MRLVFFALSLLVSSASLGSAQEYFSPQSRVEDLQNPPMGATPNEAVRSLNRTAIELIKHFEGWFEDAYDDPAGYCTIGYGHLIELAKCSTIDLKNIEDGRFATKISLDVGEGVLDEDTRTARRAVSQLVNVDLTSDQFGALTSFVFNVGKGNFERSKLLRLLNRGEYDLAATQLRRWIFADGKEFRGLKDRRSCEETLFRSDLSLDDGEIFDRSKCQSFGAAPDGEAPVDIRVGE